MLISLNLVAASLVGSLTRGREMILGDTGCRPQVYHSTGAALNMCDPYFCVISLASPSLCKARSGRNVFFVLKYVSPHLLTFTDLLFLLASMATLRRRQWEIEAC